VSVLADADDVKAGLDAHFVDTYDQVYALALGHEGAEAQSDAQPADVKEMMTAR
jgi:hypothetical protein